jgi:hypothetical protein
MADHDPSSSPVAATLEALQSQSAHSRRMRPPDLDMADRDEDRVPLKAEPEKLGRRESRLGLRSIFGRSKASNEPEPMSSLRENSSRGIRASLAEIGNWPYAFQAAKSELSLPTAHEASSSRPMSTAFVAPPPHAVGYKPKKVPPPRSKTPTPTSRNGRPSLAAWDPPPLFQAYPQAIKHAHLPACTASVDALHKLQGSKPASLASGEDADKAKKRHRRNTSGSSHKLDWTTKVYVLVTSGYLLQYAGDGSFDRLPEKILHIGKDSAAFASDLIPGKHWVLQVSSAMESDGTQTNDSRSLFSRLPFRATERRQASTFLMVFESVEDMESWMAILRREIEHLGGKKNLSETGKPKVDAEVLQLRAQPSQRTLVVRDPERFSQIITQDLPWEQEHAVVTPGIQLDAPDSETSPDHSFDDVSTTNSMISQDGRQLDSLRDSANRLSFISSGQRTFVTSEGGSSPPCSPVRDSFASLTDEMVPLGETTLEARPRPNASAIMDRRQSMQTMNPHVDFRIAATAPPRPISTYSPSWQDVVQSPPALIPNFSVPHSSGRRYSLSKSPPLESTPVFSPPSLGARVPPARGARRAPPPSLGFSRPLSVVADQPSPGATSPVVTERIATPNDDDETPVADETFKTDAFVGLEQEWPRPLSQNESELPSRKSSLSHISLTVRTVSEDRPDLKQFVLPTQIPLPFAAQPSSAWHPNHSRSKSSLGTYGRARSRSPVSQTSKERMLRRSSMYAQPSEALIYRTGAQTDPKAAAFDPSEFTSMLGSTTFKFGSQAPRASASTQHLRINSSSNKALLYRRSMPQLADGPPPLPPPTCALPPIPRKLPSNTRPSGIKA